MWNKCGISQRSIQDDRIHKKVLNMNLNKILIKKKMENLCDEAGRHRLAYRGCPRETLKGMTDILAYRLTLA